MYNELRVELTALRATLLDYERRAAPLLDEVQPALRASATNLVHYLALRAEDRRALQERLAACGFSSLGRSESHVLAAIDAVLELLSQLSGKPRAGSDALTAAQGRALLQRHADRLLGPAPVSRGVRVMVTLPSTAAHDPAQVRELMQSGMDCARINAAHDDIEAWRAMAHNVREAARELGRSCAIAVDLPGPKCRTGELEPGPEVLKLKPQRDAYGEVLEPARAWLTSGVAKRTPALPVRESFLDSLQVGSRIKLRDARGRRRTFTVQAIEDGAALIACDKTAYVRRGTKLRSDGDEASVGHLPRVEQALHLGPGDLLALTRAGPGHQARPASDGRGLHAASIPCEPPVLLDMLRVDEAVWFDDGRVGAQVVEVTPERTLVRITDARPQGEKLRAGKGINLPDSELHLPALGDDDRRALAFAVEAADLIEPSFLRSPGDVLDVQRALAAHGRRELGVILKIETRAAFERLPALLLTAMRSGPPGVMIARGDLAVELGFERLSEVQEELLWLCEAAHVPVVWATQVLETLAKTGRPTRAEVTDAAMAERAECVMLNKGPYIARALTTLDDILRRMSAHQSKKVSQFRALSVARTFSEQLVPR